MRFFIIRAFMVIPISLHVSHLAASSAPGGIFANEEKSYHEQKNDELQLTEDNDIARTPTPFPTFERNNANLDIPLSNADNKISVMVVDNNSLRELPSFTHFVESTPMDLMMDRLGITDTESNNKAFLERELNDLQGRLKESDNEISSLLLLIEQKGQEVVRLKRKSCFFHVLYLLIIASLLGVNISLAT